VKNADLRLGDCLEVLRTLPDNSVDSIVTDPPYGLTAGKKGGTGVASVNLDSPYGRARIGTGNGPGGFMGLKWDSDVPPVEVWVECLRVLKPGGYLLAFAGTRTQHRMAVRIEDAGFEIRDMIAWCYASGFPKSHNLDNSRGAKICGCAEPYTQQDGTEPPTQRDLRPVRRADVPAAESVGEERGEVLRQGVQEQGAPPHREPNGSRQHAGAVQPGLEGRGDASQAPRQLRAGAVHASAGLGGADGASGRLRDGAQAGDGTVVRLPADEDGSGAPRGPRSAAQRAPELGTVAGQPEPQAVGAWPVCRGCGLPVLPRGLGTALKPALEPITVARKPLVGTVAANVLAHGTGALNIDGCRVEPTGESRERVGEASQDRRYAQAGGTNFAATPGVRGGDPAGRWPANLIHDGSDEVLAGFPAQAGASAPVRGTEASAASVGNVTGERARVPGAFHGDTGSAARFFYCAKASRIDRGAENTHPTVKPTDLMRYLCRLVTPPGGLVLDPFMGSGSTGKAAVLEGFRFVGIERESSYLAIAEARVAAAIAKINPPPPPAPAESPQGDLFA
jgi:DNA modification methylase